MFKSKINKIKLKLKVININSNNFMPTREERRYIVWGILIAGLFGFLINIFANLYYGFFIIHDLAWGKINYYQFYACILLFLGVVGYLKFFIDDYLNSPEISKSYGKRFLHYFFYEFSLGKILKILTGIYLILLLIGLLIIFTYLFGKVVGDPIAILAVIAGLVIGYIKEKRSKHV